MPTVAPIRVIREVITFIFINRVMGRGA